MASTQALTRAQALFVKQAKQRTEGAQATADYRQKQQDEIAKTARLRALRLHRENLAGRTRPSKGGRKAV